MLQVKPLLEVSVSGTSCVQDERYPHCYIFILLALVSLRAVLPLNSTAVAIIWSPVNLPVTVVVHYTVHYTTVGEGSGRRQSNTQMAVFPSTTSSGVVGGLMTGQQYQFSISVTLAAASGQMYTGPVSTPSEPVTVGEYVILCLNQLQHHLFHQLAHHQCLVWW